MKGSVQPGFTVIETLLFLSVASVLVVSLLAGVGISVNTQRYRDSVTSFKSFLQDQYSDLKNVFNDRATTWSCNSSAVTVDGGAAAVSRGQSDCVLLGKYITISDQTITSANVVGYASAQTATTDIDVVKNDYQLGVSSVGIETKQLDWGTKIAWPVTGPEARAAGTSRTLAILIIQSPISNSVFTFTSNTVKALQDTSSKDLKEMLVTADTVPGQAARTVCIDADGLSISGNSSVYISRYTTNASGIETRSNEILSQLDGTVQC